MSAFQIQGPPQPDNQLAYVEFTSVVTISSTSAASPNDVVSAGAVSFNGSDRVCIEFYCPALVGASSGFQGFFALWDGSTDLGRIAQIGNVGVVVAPCLVRRFLTPSNGSHTFKVRGWKDSAGATVSAQGGAGGVDTQLPGYIRITKIT